MVIIATLAFKLGSGSSTSSPASATPTPTPAATATPLPVTDLYRQVVPSVVLITSKGSLGSGVIVTDTGTVLTANHVVSGAGVSILFADGTKTAATIDAAYPKIDIATLTPKKLPEVVVPATRGVAVRSDVVLSATHWGCGPARRRRRRPVNRRTETKVGAFSGLIQFAAA